MNYSERIKDLRLEKDLTQKALASLLNLTPNSICEWEKGRCAPGIDHLKNLSKIFEVSVDYIIGNADDYGVLPIHEKNVELTPDVKELVDLYHLLSSANRLQVLEYARFMAEREHVIKKRNF